MEFLKTVENVFLRYEVSMAESETDTNYGRSILKTTFNVQRMIKGVRGNSMISFLVDSVLKSLDSELKFPMEQVNLVYIINLLFLLISHDFLRAKFYVLQMQHFLVQIGQCYLDDSKHS